MAKHKRKSRAKEEEDGEEREPLFSQETRNSIIATVFFVVTLLLLLSLIGKAGLLGEYIARGSTFLFGDVSFILPFLFLAIAVSFIVKITYSHWKSALIGSLLVGFSVLGIVELISPDSGGLMGYVVSLPILAYLSRVAGYPIFLGLFLVGIMVLFNVPLFSFIRRPVFVKEEEESRPQEDDLVVEEMEEKRLSPIGKPLGQQAKTAEETSKEEVYQHADRDYVPPPLELLDEDTSSPSAGDIRANQNIIKRTLEEFGIEVEMGEVSVGPTVTQYTLRPAQGVNISRITALSRNLSLALAAHPLRIEAPIPGKSLVGIEMPNKQAAAVRLRSLMQNLLRRKLPSSLMLAFGRDVGGEPFFSSIESMPHLLVAGATGSGKSVTLNTFITTLLYLNSPKQLRFLLIDPKRVEFSIYEGIPHLLAPVVVDTKKAVNVLKWAIGEMEHRYELLEKAGTRDIKGYNAAVKKNKDFPPLPYLVIIIDEMADLMAKYKREVEATIVRLAQMARAVGIHLITSTQRPSTDVVTGLIKANITTRVALKVASQIDSRTILDQGGAEKLLGHGDMLFMSGQAFGIKRLQGTYLTEKEVKNVVKYLRELQWEDEYEALPEEVKGEGGKSLFEGFDAEDDLYEEAKQLVLEAGKASASLLQRRLQVGYARAARLLDMMEEEGVVGPAQGSKPREVVDQ